ncbi:hypothetical protein AB0M45_15410 [Nocardia sp. NPDC051787]|uniref:hypothetical protein n=1 Tax=Nocardia sp. NPDC051787 TaxID=3155415 RepID=UPI00344A3B45
MHNHRPLPAVEADVDTTEPAPDVDIIQRRHSIIETVLADLIDGPRAHMPSGRSGT